MKNTDNMKKRRDIHMKIKKINLKLNKQIKENIHISVKKTGSSQTGLAHKSCTLTHLQNSHFENLRKS